MHFDLKQAVRAVTACVLAALFAIPTNLVAQVHVVSPSELQSQVLTATQTREHNLNQVQQFFSSTEAQKALRSAHMDPTKVTAAVSSLSDAELAQLASRTQKAQADFAAGTLGDRDLLLIILAIAVLVLIIVAVR
jgi:hypothetical protein